MMDQIRDSEDAELCKGILGIVCVVHRPITLDELGSLANLPVTGDYEALSEIVGLCGSFLTLRERTISFVHQSAKDFLAKNAYNEIYPSGVEYVHHTIFSQSLLVMSKILERDIYRLGAPGFSIEQIVQPKPDPLSAARYSCLYWIDHLLDCDPARKATKDLQHDELMHNFLRRSFLYWLEALSLCRAIAKGVFAMTRLEALVEVSFGLNGNPIA